MPSVSFQELERQAANGGLPADYPVGHMRTANEWHEHQARSRVNAAAKDARSAKGETHRASLAVRSLLEQPDGFVFV